MKIVVFLHVDIKKRPDRYIGFIILLDLYFLSSLTVVFFYLERAKKRWCPKKCIIHRGFLGGEQKRVFHNCLLKFYLSPCPYIFHWSICIEVTDAQVSCSVSYRLSSGLIFLFMCAKKAGLLSSSAILDF